MKSEMPVSFLLLRGHPFAAAEPSCFALASGLAESLAEAPGSYLGLALHTSGRGELIHHQTLSPKPRIVQSLPASYQLLLGDLKLQFGLLPWWQFPDLSWLTQARGMYIPFQGWYQGNWYDGPILHLQGGKLVSYVLQGPAVKLDLPIKDITNPITDYSKQYVDTTARLLAQRSSLACGFRLLLDPLVPAAQHVSLEVNDFDIKNLVLLCLLRIAFPAQSFDLAHLPQEKPEESAWKRVCQNLGILCGKAPRPKTRLAVQIPWSQLRANLPDEQLPSMIKAINLHSSIIPHRMHSKLSG